MAKEKVFIVLTHKHQLQVDPKTGKHMADKWEVAETVEFVNQLRNRHTAHGSAICDFIEKKMITGARYGMGDFDTFKEYLYKKYPKQMAELEEKYGEKVEPTEPPALYSAGDLVTDQFGNIRPRTIFDPVP